MSVVLAMVLIAGPVALVPVARLPWAQRDTVARWQPVVVQGIGIGCPALGALDAMRPDVRIDWTQLPTMYGLSGLGQEIPIELPRWWVNASVYAGIGLVGMGLGRWWKR
jgi:hypothetical protein